MESARHSYCLLEPSHAELFVTIEYGAGCIRLIQARLVRNDAKEYASGAGVGPLSSSVGWSVGSTIM